MTCIVGFIDKEKQLWMGGDSVGSTNSLKQVRQDVKVFRNGNFLIGYTSSFRMGQLLRFTWKPPVQKSKRSDYAFMCTEVIESIRKCLDKHGCMKIQNNEETIGQFLIGYKNKLYQIEPDLQVAQAKDSFDACGCGGGYALGALDILSKQNISSKQILLKALTVAAKFSPFVGKPFKIIKY